MLRARWLAVPVVGLLGVALGVYYGLQSKQDRAPAPVTPAFHPDREQRVPSRPPLGRPLVHALPPIKVTRGGTTWSPNPGASQPSIESQRGAPDIPGAQPLRPPPSDFQ
ncbi:hypothetical protein FAZ95_36230 [Trinickia violacea]|uniref:Uncharacterized protein n=1 Tax=Trinickia violacea TaxID=2571746 RepID=A0A4P8J5Z6_9BURK|nr:hypothetical protein [Trinickia violacea]QCP54389.1 hypothetical protein FAZ95_36230 [Trinickia violacea]